jgi:serine/threonine protein kinase/class 3 adenylate cyclase
MANLPPSGTVTFLFTDIEGSATLWEQDPAAMQRGLARHDALLKNIIEAHGGYIFKMVGDACCAAFSTAREALEAALAAQRALLAERWDRSGPIRVRMALHTGVAEERDGDYFGPPLNRVARLLSAAHGGQVLLSSTTRGLCQDYLGSEVRLTDLGEHHLKDLTHPERIFQLEAPDLLTNFPPVRTMEMPSDLERYRIIRSLGGGGMAKVYLAHDELLDRNVALKVLRRQYAEDEESIERFRREARNAAALSHPNIVQIYDRGETAGGTYYITMEYMPEGTLKERILKQGAFPASTAVAVALQVARALQAAHARGIIHRDIKPQNILLGKSGEVKVADFGIARAVAATMLTKAGSVLGTTHYVSPEQAWGDPVTIKSDLYSLGVILYEMLTGEVPYDADTPVAVVMKHINAQLRPPKEVNPQVPEGLNAINVRLLAKDPAERYSDAGELVGDLERVKEGLAPSAATVQTAGDRTDQRDQPVDSLQARPVRAGPTDQAMTDPVSSPAHPSDSADAPSRNLRRWGVLAVLAVVLVGAVVAVGVVLYRHFVLFDEPSTAATPHEQERKPSKSPDHPKPSEPSHNDPFFAAREGDASSEPKPIPDGDRVPLPPAEYKTTVFEPALTFRIPEEGWELRHHEFTDVIGLKKGDLWLAFLNVEKVYPESKSASKPAVPAPDDMVVWVKNHDYLKTGEQHSKVVGGETGVQFDHVDVLAAHEGKICDSCVPLFLLHKADESGNTAGGNMEHSSMHERGMVYALRDGESGRMIILPNVEGKRVIILVQGTHEALEQSLRQAEKLLDSVRWEA